MTISTTPQANALSPEHGPRSGFANFRSIVIGRLFSALSVWLAIVALTKMSDPATVGMYALAQAICIPIAEVSKMSLREVRSSDHSGQFVFGDYLGLRLLAVLVALALMMLFGFLQSDSAVMLMVMLLYAVARGAELISDMIYGLFQAHERMEYIGRSLCMLGPLSLCLLVAGYWLTGSLAVAVLGQLVAHIAVLGLYDLRLGLRRARLVGDVFLPRFLPSALSRLARHALPLTVSTLLIISALYFPRIAVEHELGLTGLGLFAAIFAMAMAPDRLVNAMGVAVSVRLARHYAARHHAAFLRLLAGLATTVAVCGSVGIALCALYGEAILRFVYTEEYARYGTLLVLLVTAATLRGVANILRYGVVAARRFWWLGAQNAAAALVAIATCLILIPRYGLTGAGMAMVLVFAIQLFVVLGALIHAVKFPSQKEPCR